VVAAVILAAGGSARLGRPKALVRIAGETLLRRAARVALEAGCTPVLLVLGAEAPRLREETLDLPVEAVVNEHWDEGLGTSVAAGVQALARFPETTGVLLMPCDQTRLSPAVLRRLIEAWDGRPDGRAACAYGGMLGTPALFGRGWLGDLRALRGERGARGVLRAPGPEPARIDWPEGEVDLDTPADLDCLDG